MLKNFFTGAVLQWLFRRLLEVGGVVTFLVSIIASIDPVVLQKTVVTIQKLLAGDFENVSIAAVIGLVALVWGLIWNALSNFRGGVTVDGKKVPMKKLPNQTLVEVIEDSARTVIKRKKPPLLFERLFGKRG